MLNTIYESCANCPIATSIACGYFLYYFYKVVHRPCLVAAEGNFKSTLTQRLNVLKEHYWPTFWAFSTHFQTICRVLFKSKPYIPYDREILKTPDNGQLSLDWLENDEDNKIYPDPSTRPTVICLPGITGCSDDSYMRHIVLESKSLGYRATVFNNRGMGKVTLKTPRTFCACNAEDLEFVLEHVSKKYPDSRLLIFAVSLGGVILTNYLYSVGESKFNVVAALLVSVPWDCTETTNSLEKPINWMFYNRFILNKLKALVHQMVLTNYIVKVGKPKVNVVGALVVSAPWDSFMSTASLEKPINWLFYNRHLANNLKGLVKQNLHVFEEHITQLPYKLEDVMKAQSIREFDEVLTCKTFGFQSCVEYYSESSLSSKQLEKIKLPMLFLNARDDPFAPEESIPLDAIKKSPNMAIILTDYGGHIGFVEGPTIRGRSFVERLFSQYATCMLNGNN